MAPLSFLDHILKAAESPSRENKAIEQKSTRYSVTYLKEVLKFVRKLMQAGAVICDGFPCFLKFFA